MIDDFADRAATGHPDADVAGTGWRRAGDGKTWYRIERGPDEYRTWMAARSAGQRVSLSEYIAMSAVTPFGHWMRFLRQCGRSRFADTVAMLGHTFVPGPSPAESGPAFLAHLDAHPPRRRGGEA